MSSEAERIFFSICEQASKKDWEVISADVEIIGDKKESVVKELIENGLIEKVENIGQHYIRCQITLAGRTCFYRTKKVE